MSVDQSHEVGLVVACDRGRAGFQSEEHCDDEFHLMVEICGVDPKTYERLAHFLAQENPNEDAEFWMKRFPFWWDDNPAASCASELGWVLDDGGTIVGFIGVIPTRFQLAGRLVTAFNATTWRVLPAYRHLSMKLLFRVLQTSRQSIFFNTTPNVMAKRIFDALKFHQLPGSAGNANSRRVSFALIKNVRRQLRRQMFSGVLGAPMAVLLSPLVKALQSFRLRHLRSGALPVREMFRADSSYDVLWEETKHMYANTAVRTAEAINWFCFRPTGENLRLFGCYSGDALVGYCIGWIRESSGARLMECVDLWARPDGVAVVRSLVGSVIDSAAREGCDCVIFPHFNRSVGQALHDIGLFERSMPRAMQFFKTSPPIADQMTKSNVYVTDMEGDITFFS